MYNVATLILVPLGDLLNNKNKFEDMVDIICHMYQHDPIIEYSIDVLVERDKSSKPRGPFS